jgi:acyl dehydratase
MSYFEDFRVGQREEFGRHTFLADEIKDYARRYDPQPFHLDEAAAARSHFGALCASGWHTAAMWMRYYIAHRVRTSGELAPAETGPSPGIRNLRWPRPVYAGDTVTFASKIVELRDRPERPGWGLMIAQGTGVNQKGELVLAFRGAQFVKKRTSQEGR